MFAVLHRPAIAWTIFAVSIALTVLAWAISDRAATRLANERFAFEVEEATGAISKRILEYEQVLRGGVGLLNAARRIVTRGEWREFVQTLDIDRYFPGIQGIGFARFVGEPDRTALIDTIRAEGFPDFTVRPPGMREQYTPIIYLEPFEGRNLRAFGFDMFSEEVRRSALQRATDTGTPAASGRVTLVQETGEDPQHGFLLYMPVYTPGMTTATVMERRAAIAGFVYAPFRMRDLMAGIVNPAKEGIGFAIHDAIADPAQSLLFDSRAARDGPSRHTTQRSIVVAGQPWHLEFASGPVFEAATASNDPTVVAIGGLLIDLALFVTIWSLSGQKARIESRVTAMTRELAASRDHYRLVLDEAPRAILEIGPDLYIVLANHQCEAVFATTREAIVGTEVTRWIPDLGARCHALLSATATMFDGRNGIEAKYLGRTASGEQVPLEVRLLTIETPGGRQLLATLTDTSVRDDAARALNTALAEKTLLLNEVHHRVKNNLQVVCSMLSLQSAHTTNADARAVLDESHARVQAMGLVHQLLYEGGSFSHVHLGTYLERLAHLLHRTVGTSNVHLAVHGMQSDLRIELERGVSCGLVINELIMNAFRHAFVGRSGGVVTVELSVDPDGEACVIVADDGVGLPDAASGRSPDSLGLRLVPLLLEQARARMTHVRGKGTRYEIRMAPSHTRALQAETT